MIALATTQLAACQTTQSGSPETGTPAVKNDQSINEAIERAALSAGLGSEETRMLSEIEKTYKRDSDNPLNALNYGRALRKAQQFVAAEAVLKPFADKKDGMAEIKEEMSSVQLELGKFSDAEKYAQDAVLLAPEDYIAYRNLGIALEAKGMHAQAERAFRKSLEFWKGDPTPIMNNLALNLATQGFVDEAIDILERAKEIAPDNVRIERNLRIVKALNER